MWMMIIPAITVLVLFFLFRERSVWWEYLVPVVVSIASITLLDKACDYAMASDTEYHGGWVIKATWDEHWTEKYTTTSTDKKGHSHTTTHYRHHPDVYSIQDSNGYEVEIDSSTYAELAGKFSNEEKTKPWRSGQSSWGDGHRFVTSWPESDATYTPCITQHRYENRVARSDSVFNFRDVNPVKYGLYQYPDIYDYYKQDSILGVVDQRAENLLTRFNCQYGSQKKVRVFIVVFQNKPIDAGIDQQMYWKNGNKNEVVITIGVEDNKNISWVYPFAWDNEALKVDLREDIAELKQLDLVKIVKVSTDLVLKEFKLKNFDEFEYISLEPPWWATLLCFLVNVGINVGMIYWIINNGHTND